MRLLHLSARYGCEAPCVPDLACCRYAAIGATGRFAGMLDPAAAWGLIQIDKLAEAVQRTCMQGLLDRLHMGLRRQHPAFAATCPPFRANQGEIRKVEAFTGK